MSHFAVMLIWGFAGAAIRRIGRLPISFVSQLNRFILTISLPAVIFAEVPLLFRDAQLTRSLAVAIAVPWIHFFITTALILYLARPFKWQRSTQGALILTAGLGNTSFMGFPIVEAFFGKPGLQIAILIDQFGSFFILATLGLFTASLFSGRNFEIGSVIKRILFFPPFVALIFSIFWGLSHFPVEGVGVNILKKIAFTLVPLVLFSVGWQIDLSDQAFKKYAGPLSFGLAFKLLAWPFLTLLMFYKFLYDKNLILDVTVVESAMAPMMTGAVVASEFDLEPELAQLMVSLGVPFSLLTVVLWKTVIEWLKTAN